MMNERNLCAAQNCTAPPEWVLGMVIKEDI
jgi:hypothetical protein